MILGCVHDQVQIGGYKPAKQTSGHIVLEHKIVQRYHRSLSLLMSAVEHRH